jgi:CDP-diglyceride synthetase
MRETSNQKGTLVLMTGRSKTTYWQRRRERYRRYGPVLYLFPAFLWLCLSWFFFFFMAVFASDSGTPEARTASAWVFWTGFVLGLAPLLTVIVLTIRRMLNPPPDLTPEPREPINWKLYGVLLGFLLIFAVLSQLIPVSSR